MDPMFYYLARIIHEERIQAAQRKRPEWWYYDQLSPARPRPWSSGVRQLRRSVALALQLLASRLEP